jgi:DNA-binding NtrC family response regulator
MGAVKKAILDVGRELSFRKLRQALMSAAGYRVTSVGSAASAERIGRRKYDALIVGAWVPPAERNRLVKFVRAQNPGARVVFYYDEKIEGTEAADAILNYRGDHHDLVRILQHLFRKTKAEAKERMHRTQRGLAALLLALGPAFAEIAQSLG